MAMRSLLRPLLHNAGLAAGLLSMLAACAGGNRFVLLEDEDGGVGAIVVENRGGSRTLSELHAATEVGSAGTAPSAPQTVDSAEIQATWGDALAASPMPPRSFLFYFLLDRKSTRLNSSH